MVTASTISFLCILEPGLSRSRTMWVIPALYPMNAVRWTGFFGSSLGKLFTFPICLEARFLGRNPSEPCRGASNFRCDMSTVFRLGVVRVLEQGFFLTQTHARIFLSSANSQKFVPSAARTDCSRGAPRYHDSIFSLTSSGERRSGRPFCNHTFWHTPVDLLNQSDSKNASLRRKRYDSKLSSH